MRSLIPPARALAGLAMLCLTIPKAYAQPFSNALKLGTDSLLADCIAAGDFDNDGDQDVVGILNSQPLYFENIGSPAVPLFRAGKPDTLGLPPTANQGSIYSGDLDNDLDVDIMIDGILYENQIPGGSWEFVKTATAGSANGLGLGDVDGDGDLDIWRQDEWEENEGTISAPVFSGSSHAFDKPLDYDQTNMRIIADLNNDGIRDQIISTATQSFTRFAASASQWSVPLRTNLLLQFWDKAIATDLSGDGFPDILFPDGKYHLSKNADLNVSISEKTGGLKHGCDLSAVATMGIRILNAGRLPVSNIPIAYTVNGGAVKNDMMTGTLAPGADIIFATIHTENLSADGVYEYEIYTELVGDTVTAHDTLVTRVFNMPVISNFPYVETFENSDHLWSPALPYSWSIADIGGNAFQGSKVLTMNDNPTTATTYIAGPCFDFGSTPKRITFFWSNPNNTAGKGSFTLNYGPIGLNPVLGLEEFGYLDPFFGSFGANWQEAKAYVNSGTAQLAFHHRRDAFVGDPLRIDSFRIGPAEPDSMVFSRTDTSTQLRLFGGACAIAVRAPYQDSARIRLVSIPPMGDLYDGPLLKAGDELLVTGMQNGFDPTEYLDVWYVNRSGSVGEYDSFQYQIGSMTDWNPTIYTRYVEITGTIAAPEIAPKATIAIAPNPTQGMTEIVLPAFTSSVSIASISGRLIYQASAPDQRLRINTADWNSGLYVITAEHAHGREPVRTQMIVY